MSICACGNPTVANHLSCSACEDRLRVAPPGRTPQEAALDLEQDRQRFSRARLRGVEVVFLYSRGWSLVGEDSWARYEDPDNHYTHGHAVNSELAHERERHVGASEEHRAALNQQRRVLLEAFRRYLRDSGWSETEEGGWIEPAGRHEKAHKYGNLIRATNSQKGWERGGA